MAAAAAALQPPQLRTEPHPCLPQPPPPPSSFHSPLKRSIKTSSGALAVITLDAAGAGGAQQRVQIVGDANRATLAGKSSAADLQTVRALGLCLLWCYVI